MNTATKLKDDANSTDVIYSKPYLTHSGDDKVSANSYVVDPATWEEEVEQVGVLSNN